MCVRVSVRGFVSALWSECCTNMLSLMNPGLQGKAISLSVQGMAGRGVSLEFNSAARCCQAALSLATAGQQSEEELDMGAQEEEELGGCSAVLDDEVLSSRFSFLLTTGILLAWERCLCSCLSDGPADGKKHGVPGILYVCTGGLIFLPDRYCKCSGEAALRSWATVLPQAQCRGVQQTLGGLNVTGSWLGRRPDPLSPTGWTKSDLRPGPGMRESRATAVALHFHAGLSKDFEALSHAAYGCLLEACEGLRAEQHHLSKESEADRARGKVWAKSFAQHTGHQLRKDKDVRAAILGEGEEGEWLALAFGRVDAFSLSLSLSLTHTHSHTRTQAFRSRRSRVSRLARLARAALSTSANARSAPTPSAAAFSLSVSLAADGSYATWACPGPYVTGYSHPPMAMAADTFGSDACFRP